MPSVGNVSLVKRIGVTTIRVTAARVTAIPLSGETCPALGSPLSNIYLPNEFSYNA
jgi:hypothetical protein